MVSEDSLMVSRIVIIENLIVSMHNNRNAIKPPKYMNVLEDQIF